MGFLKYLWDLLKGIVGGLGRLLPLPGLSEDQLRSLADGQRYSHRGREGTIASTIDWYTDALGRAQVRKVYLQTDDGDRTFLGDYVLSSG